MWFQSAPGSITKGPILLVTQPSSTTLRIKISLHTMVACLLIFCHHLVCLIPFCHFVIRGNSPFYCVDHAWRRSQPNPFHHRGVHCVHSKEMRMLHGTCWTPEIMKMLNMRYHMLKIHQVHHFPEQQRKCGLFASYFNIGLQIKQESSGWPSWVTVVATEPDPMVLWQKQGEYLERYLEKGGVYLFFYLRKNAWNKMFSECFVYLCRYGFGKRPNIQEPRAKDYHKINVEQFLGEVQRITKQDQSQPNDWSLWTVEHYRKPPERCTGIQILSVDMIEVISRRREVIKPPLKTRTRVDALTSMRLPSRPGRHA